MGHGHIEPIYINNKLLWARKYARTVVRGYCLFWEANSCPRANQGQLFVHISKAKSSLLSLLSFKYLLSQRKQPRKKKKKKHEAKHVDFLVLSGTAFSTSFPDFLISKLKENTPFRSLFARRRLLAVSRHYWLITSAHERTLLGHMSRFYQSRMRRNIWWIIRDNMGHAYIEPTYVIIWVMPILNPYTAILQKFRVHQSEERVFNCNI